MEYTEKQLLEKKREIEKAKTKVSELKGEEKALLKQLKEDWECTTLIKAKKKIKKLESDNEKLLQEIEEKTAELKTKYVDNEESD